MINDIQNFLLGTFQSWRKYPRGAAKHYAYIVDSRPESTKFRYKLAYEQWRDKQYRNCLSNIEKLQELAPDNSDYRHLKLRCLFKLSEYDEVITLTKSPKDYQDCVIGADALLEKGHLREAGNQYNLALQRADNPNQKSYCLHSLGYIASCLGDTESVAKFYQEAVDTSPNRAIQNLGIGVLHAKRGWYNDALSAYQSQIEINPEDPELYFNLAKTYAKLLKVDKAAEFYRMFVEKERKIDLEGSQFNEKLVIFDSFMGRSYSDSPKAIYQRMLRDKKYSGYKFVWVLRGHSWRKYWRIYINRRTDVVGYGSREYFRAYARAKYWVTNSRIPYVLKTNPEQIYLQCWHGTPLKRMGHSIVEKTQSSKYDKAGLVELYDHETRRFDYLLSPSRAASSYLSDAFGLEQLNRQDALLEKGYPRNDILINYKTSDVDKVKKNLGIPRDKKVLLYAPTWRDDQHDKNHGYTYKTEADFDYLQKQIGDDWVILFRAHYFIANTFNFRKYRGFIYDVSNIEDINDLYIISDVLMTDYSSVFFDYANLRRPIIYFMYDLEYYMKNLRGFYIDLKELPGDITKTESEIVDILSDTTSYQQKHAKTYQAFHDKFNYLDDGKASKRVLDSVIQ